MQTSPFGSVVNIPGLVGSPDLRESELDLDDFNERKYFIYLVSDGTNSFYNKNCIGRVVLPPRTRHMTLSDLRDSLVIESHRRLVQLTNVMSRLPGSKRRRIVARVNQSESAISIRH